MNPARFRIAAGALVALQQPTLGHALPIFLQARNATGDLQDNNFLNRNISDHADTTAAATNSPLQKAMGAVSTEDTSGFSYHADPFEHIEQDVLTLVLAAVALIIAASGGIGGGGILVPLFMLVLGFHPKHAIALSNITILGGAIANTGLNLTKQHPQLDRPLIDWDLITIMEPLTMFGAIFGSLLSKVLPNVLLNTSLVIVLIYTGHKTFTKGTTLWKEETEKFANEGSRAAGSAHHGTHVDHNAVKEVELASPSGRQPLVDSQFEIESDGDVEKHDNPQQGDTAPPPALEAWHSPPTFHSRAVSCGEMPGLKESRGRDDESYFSLDDNGPGEEDDMTRKSSKTSTGTLGSLTMAARAIVSDQGSGTKIKIKVKLLVVCLTGTCVLTVLKGGGHFRSPFGFHCGSGKYWLLYFASLPWVFGFALYFRRMLLIEYFQKVDQGYTFAKGEVMWSPSNTIRYPAICAISGLFAGMFGVGGGIVKGPLMLEMGVMPAVASASAATMVLFTSACASVSFVVFGLLHFEYSILFFSLGFLCTVFGQCSVGRWLRRQDRQSPIVLSIGLVMLLSAALVGLNTIIVLASSARNTMLKGHGVCSHLVS
mmetsp:Transcript_18937/g.44054  ORF Transcript_18937/g.44054 Transcript_18937/m.44054 type:complete len:600 (+) Transcript_18937:101-1900(+)